MSAVADGKSIYLYNIYRKILIALEECRGQKVVPMKQQCHMDIRKWSFSQGMINGGNQLSTEYQLCVCFQECTRKEGEYSASAAESREKFRSVCRQMGIEVSKQQP